MGSEKQKHRKEVRMAELVTTGTWIVSPTKEVAFDHRKDTIVKTKLSMLIATLIAITTLALEATSARADAPQVPFNASITTKITSLTPTEVDFRGSGVATLMGLSQDNGRAVLTGPGSCQGGITNDDYETLTAANGDTLTILSSNLACPTGGGYYHATGHWVVIGGTGRFSGATGSGSMDCQSFLALGGRNSFQITGTISAPNAG
jgi:hypothetical protein